MSSDIDEVGEDADGTCSPTGAQSSNDEFGQGRQRYPSGRRCSLPSDRPSAAIRRHLQQFKTRRKVSAPSAPPGITTVTMKSATSSPLENMTGYPLAELLERLRPAASSRQASTSDDSGVTEFSNDPSSGTRRYSMDSRSYRSVCSSSPSRTVGSIDEGFQSGIDDGIRKPLFVDTNLANTVSGNSGPATVPWRCLYYRQSSVTGVIDEESHFPRARSNSEAGRYLLMRKCTDYRAEFVGKLEEGGWAYCQILATLKCSDLMPPLAKMVVFDSSLPIRKAFLAFVHNNIRAAPIWDSQKKLFVGLLTVTDLMHLLVEHAGGLGDTSVPTTPTRRKVKQGKSFEETLDLPLHTRTTSAATSIQKGRECPTHFFASGHHPYHLNHLIYALADETVSKAAKLLCDRRLHRLLILDPEKGGNPLFLLTKKDVIKALRKYIAKLPLPQCMEKTLDELLIGTWSDIVTVTPKTTIHRALSLFLGKGLSALPVVDANQRIVDMLTKVDVTNLVIESSGPVECVLKKSVQDAIQRRPAGAEKMTTCSKKATMMLAVECILHSGAHRLAIVDSDSRLVGMLSLADLMRFLTSGFSCEFM